MLHGPNSTEVKNLLDYLKETAIGRDPSWFNLSNKEILGWTIIPNVAYSCMQVFGNDVRMLTRCYIEPTARSKVTVTPHRATGELTPTFKMVKEQLNYAKNMGFNHAFFSTEYNRRNVVKRHASIGGWFGFDIEVLEGRYRTCNGTKALCHQNIGLYRLSDKPFGLPRVE